MAGFAARERFLDVELEGVNDFRRALARAEKDLRKRFDKAIREAAKTVRDDARGRYYDFYQRHSGRSPKGITSGASFGLAKIKLGDARRPYLLGQEWGGRGRPTTQQFPPHGREGRFFWPTGVEGGERVEKATLEAMDDAVAILVGRR